jgi:Transposase DDE domain
MKINKNNKTKSSTKRSIKTNDTPKTKNKSKTAASSKISKSPPLKKKIQPPKITNWSQYNDALVRRGSITLWITEDAISNWHNAAPTGKAGRPKSYSDIAIDTALMIQSVYKLTLRSTEGFMNSILTLIGASVKSPDYSTLSYRTTHLNVTISQEVKDKLSSGEPIHLAIDSTGVKIFGEGEWKVKKHGWAKHRTWRKIHLGVDTNTHLIPAVEVTTNDKGDAQTLPDLIDQTIAADIDIGEVSGDGAYDAKNVYLKLKENNITPIIPPQKNAKIWKHGNSAGDKHSRDQALRRIRKAGKPKWKRESGYHKRSLSETAMFRLKTIFGSSISARNLKSQITQVKIRVNALNRMTLQRMPTRQHIQDKIQQEPQLATA